MCKGIIPWKWKMPSEKTQKTKIKILENINLDELQDVVNIKYDKILEALHKAEIEDKELNEKF